MVHAHGPRVGLTPARHLVAAVLVVGGLFACAPPSAGPAATAAPPARQASPPPAAVASPASDPAKAPAAEPQVSVKEVNGGSIEYARAILAPTAVPMKQCRTKAPTAIRVRITSENGEAALSIEPGSAVDGSIRRCVLEALSTIELPDATPAADPRQRTSGFSSLVTVEW